MILKQKNLQLNIISVPDNLALVAFESSFDNDLTKLVYIRPAVSGK